MINPMTYVPVGDKHNSDYFNDYCILSISQGKVCIIPMTVT